MNIPKIVWLDLRNEKDEPGIHRNLPSTWELEVVNNGDGVSGAIAKYQPNVLCLDYDLPDKSNFKIIENIRSRHPWLPVVVLTHDKTVEMAVWALRLRVWDYIIKPMEIDGLISSLMGLPVPEINSCKHQNDCKAIQPITLPEFRSRKTNSKEISFALAASYVREHLDKKITLEIVAKLSGMSKSHFSRSFRNSHGITFQNFLAQHRIDKALTLLQDSDLQITQVAFAVGFAELSSFTRTFQRHIGMSPSYYRKAIMSRLLKNKDGISLSTGFPKANPNPVLSVGPEGIPQYVNPAATHLLKEIGLQNVEYILPTNHRMLVKKCLETGTPMSEERKIAGRTIVWSYCPIDDSKIVHLYGNDIYEHLSNSPDARKYSSDNLEPVHSLERDGIAHFVNPATFHLLEELELKNIEDILPLNHKDLVKSCLKTRTPLAEECSTAGQKIIWSYYPGDSGDAIHIYSEKISDYDERKQ